MSVTTAIAGVFNFVIMMFLLFSPLIIVFLFLRQKALDYRVSQLEQLLAQQYGQPTDQLPDAQELPQGLEDPGTLKNQ